MSNQETGKTRVKVALVVGAGDALGSAVAKKFAAQGYTICAVRRSVDKLASLAGEIKEMDGRIHTYGIDARKEEQVIELFRSIENDIGDIEVVVFNIGANVQFPITETTAQKYYKVWEMAAFAGFLVGREAAKCMLPRSRGTVIFTGATASTRGGANFAAFAGAKHALRALAQSMARELGPKGIHVAHVLIDGAIDTEFIRTLFPERYALKDVDGILNPDQIADNYVHLHKQPRTSWTFEMDLRPYMETW